MDQDRELPAPGEQDAQTAQAPKTKDDLQVGEWIMDGDEAVYIRVSKAKLVLLVDTDAQLQKNADRMTDREDGGSILMMANRTIFGIREVNGKKIDPPGNDLQANDMLKLFKGSEFDMMRILYSRLFIKVPKGEALKN